MTYRDINPNIAGIYIFKNNINGKCYIGQGVSLRKRIKHHFSNIRTQRYDLPLYRAINKYGLHNFTIDILESFIPDNISNEELIKKLDKLEIEYIKKYNSYHNGYNCTIGGDYGVLGLKMTDAQKKNVSKAIKENIAKGIIGKRVYMYNFKEKYYIYAWTIKDAANITKLSRANISRLCNHTYIKPYCSNFIAAHSMKELNALKEKLNDCNIVCDGGKFKNKYQVIVNINGIEKKYSSVKEVADSLNKSTSLIYAVLNGHKKIKGIELTKAA